MTEQGFRDALSVELDRILGFWLERMPDYAHGGFLGTIDWQDRPQPESDKGAVLNARILWTFSAAYRLRPSDSLKEQAQRAYQYLHRYFLDPVYGGVYWSLDYTGQPKETKKQVYALAFALYACAEYYAAFGDVAALGDAVGLWRTLEENCRDTERGGYYEAFTRDWAPIEDQRLSDKDANEKKTMNTHLHIAEAYACLYKVAPHKELRDHLMDLLQTIDRYFIDETTGHLRLFFNEEWVEKKDVVSYGHDIEAAWLLLDCAEAMGNDALIKRYQRHCVRMADATCEGLDVDGGLWYEYDPADDRLIAEKHWWPQAELWLGFHKAWELTKKSDYLDIVYRNWTFTQSTLFDYENGEWRWGVYADGSPIEKDKAGFWKCPYHNGRACIELLRRL